MITFLRRGIRAPVAKIALATVMATAHLRTNFEEEQVYIADQLNLEKELDKLPAPRGIHETNTGKKGDKKKGGGGGGPKGRQPWDTAEGRWDLDGINAGKYDSHLKTFFYKKGRYTDAEWAKLHPMIRRKKYLATHNPDGSFKPFKGGFRGGGGAGSKRTITSLEAELAEMQKKNKMLEEAQDRSSSAGNGGGGTSNAGNPALNPHGGTRHRFKDQP